jgi:xylan 1,4-beta-xylosidase
MDLIKSYSYWHLTDFENTSISTTLFFGGSGMFLSNGIAKPIVGAYENLYKMLDEVLARGNNYVITRDSKNPKHILIILYNYEHPSQSDNLNLEPDDKYKFFINKERNKVHLTINSIPYTECYLREFSINRYHGNPYDRWILMGKPDTDVFHRGLDVVNNLLKSAENPDYKETKIHINNNIFSYEVNMDPLEVKSIDIFLK